MLSAKDKVKGEGAVDQRGRYTRKYPSESEVKVNSESEVK
jgi:hypothetical protein